MRYLALCCIAKDEDPFLREWLAYHSLLGVEHFYVYDNCSRRPVSELLKGFAGADRVTVRRIQGSAMQLPAYNDCLATAGSEFRWLGFIDLDEFLLPLRDDDLRVLLGEFEDYGGLCAPWHLFGSSGHLARPAGPVIRNYTEAFDPPDSFQSKCIVQAARVAQALSPHFFSYRDGYYCVNDEHYPLPPLCQPSFSSGRLLRVNHYFVRSQEDFEEKLARGRGDSAGPEKRHERVMFENALAHPCKEDREIQRFLPALEDALARGVLPPAEQACAAGLPYDDLMAAALAHFNAGDFARTQLCLCYGGPDARARADYWTLRAMAALEGGEARRADVFIRRSLRCEATLTGFRQLEKQLRLLGRADLADNVRAMCARYPDFFH